MTNRELADLLRVDLMMIVELSDAERECLSAAGVAVVGDVDLRTLMSVPGLPGSRAVDIFDAITLFMERMLRT